MKLTTNLLIIISFLLFGLQFTQAQCDGTSDIIQNSTNRVLSTTTQINVGMGNSFTATCSGVIEGVSFWTFRVPGTIGQTSVTVELYRNPFSNSRVLLSSVTTDISFQNEGSLERYFEFPNSPSLVAGTVYGVRLTSNETGQIIDMELHTGNRLAGGNMFADNFDQSSPWSTRDLRFQIHYEDNVAPIANCRNITRTLGADGTVSISANNINNNSTDADSSIASLFLSQNTFDCSNIGENTVNLTVRDQNGNANSCQATVTILDETPPVLTCPGDMTIYVDPGESAQVNYEVTYDDCTVETPDGFTFLAARNGKSYFLSQSQALPSAALTSSIALGGHLATIENEEDNDMIRSAANAIINTAPILIGYNDIASEGNFVWQSGSSSTYTNWNSNEPNNLNNQDFTQIGADGKWSDISFTAARYFVVERSQETITQTSGFASGDFFPVGTTTNTFEATDAFGQTGTCSFDITVIENPFETSVVLNNGKLTITDIENDSDDQITLSTDGSTLTISNLVLPTVSGGPILADATTVNIPMASITDGIEFLPGNGDNRITFDDDIIIDGDLELKNISRFRQNGTITVNGTFKVTESIALDLLIRRALTVDNLEINNIDSLDDLTPGYPITVTGTTTIQTNEHVDLSFGATAPHTFGGLVNIDASYIYFFASGNTTFGNITTTYTESDTSVLMTSGGNLTLTGDVQTAAPQKLTLRSDTYIEQTGGSITTDALLLHGASTSTVSADLTAGTNNTRVLKTEPGFPLNEITYTDTDAVEIGDNFTVNEFTLTANTFTFAENSNLVKNGANTSHFNGAVDVTATGNDTEASIDHNAGTINFTGNTNDFTGKLNYDGAPGTISNFSGITTINTEGISPEFGSLNINGTCTIDVFTIASDLFSVNGATNILKGAGTLSGAQTSIQGNGIIAPGEAGAVTTLTTNDLLISSGTFTPTIDSNTDFDTIEVIGSVTLTNATFTPVGGFTPQAGDQEIILLNNDGSDAIVGTFNGYAEGSIVQIGDYAGIISYVGGDGNDLSLSSVETEVNLVNGKLTITDVNGGTSDDQITFSNDGTTLTISNLTMPVQVIGGPTLTDVTTITIPLANITNGIEFVSEAGNNAVTITDDLTLSGTTNNLKLNNLGGYTQTGAITIGGDLEIIGDGNVIFNLAEITAGSLSVTNNAGIMDAGGAISISGATSLSSSERISIDQGQGNHQFGGIVNIDAKGAFFTAGADTTFGTVTFAEPVLGGGPFLNYFAVAPGTIDFSDTVSIPGTADIDSNLFIFSTEAVTQSSGTISADFLVLYGNGATIVTLDKANAFKGLAAVNPFNANNIGVSNVTINSTETLALEEIIVNEFNITAPILRTFPDFTVISKNGTGESILNGNVFVQNGTSGIGSGIIEHNSGTITINGDTIDLTARITYDGASGTVTNLNANTVRFPFASDNASVTFGTLNANTNVNIGDDTITILNEANFGGSGTVVNGTATISGGSTIISDTATITPGTSTVVASITTGNFEITDATYAPRVESDTSYDNISVVGSVTLSNATLSPTEGFVSNVTNAPIILIANDGIDPVIGTFNNLPENAGVSFGDYVGMITYSGGNGNDVSLVPDTINPTAVCQDLNFAIGLDGITINATQIDNGSSDNASIASFLVNGQPQITYTYDDLGSHTVTLTVTDTSGNIAECTATITLTSDVTFPIVISEFLPLPTVSNQGPTQSVEIKGAAGETFVGVLVIIDGDNSRNGKGVVADAHNISGTFDANGILSATVPDFTDPAHTAVLTTSFSGEVGVTDVDSDNDNTVDDVSTFGVIFDAVGVQDGGICCPVSVTYADDFGGVNLASIGIEPSAIFRVASDGDFYQLKDNGEVYDANGNIVDASIFDTTPTIDGTFGQINPMISLNMNPIAFITTWKTDNPGNSADNQITIYTDSNETYDYIIDWGDGTIDTNVTGNSTHTYSTAGTYTIGITGTFPKFVSSGDKLKLLSVDQWGDIAWTSFENAFRECRNMDVVATDVPDLSNVTSLFGMFDDCQALVGNPTFNTWDVSTIQTMQLMFVNALSFNQPLNNWNVSNVTNMSSMFNAAEAFNQDLNNWNTSQVQFMDFMFVGAEDFNGAIGNWNVSNVIEMSYMFNRASAFNQDLNSWNVSNVQEMDFMFLEATNFNGNISSWNPAQVTTMNAMFQFAVNFNQDISGWNVANVSDMGFMFRDATNFNQNLSNWNVSNVAVADFMLAGTAFSETNYDLLLIHWNQLTLQNNVNFGTDAGFCLGEMAKQSIMTNHSWNFVDGGQNCGEVFVTKWKTDNTGTSADNQITIPTATALGTTYDYIVDWGDGTLQTNITGDATHTYATTGTYTVRILGDFPHIYFNLTGDYSKLIEIEQWGSNPWSSMERAFRGCENLVISATDAPDLSNVINIDRMLQAAGRNIDMSLWADISHWDLSNVESMSSLFRDTNFNQNIGAWNVSNVTNMSRVFQNNPVFNQDISTWNVGNVTNMFGMFFQASNFNQNISTWDVSKVENMQWMLRGMTNFDQNLGTWDISSVTNMGIILRATTLSTENYDNTLIGWATLDTDAGETQIPTNIGFNANTSFYCNGEYKRQELITNFGWTITDAGKAADCTNSFITTWQTTADNESITIPTTGTGYEYLVDWGDGTIDLGMTGNATHTYATAGTYTVSITGTFPQIYFNNTGDRLKIKSVTQWGTNAWLSMENAFRGCEQLDVTATDTPNLTNVTTLSGMFGRCLNLVGNASFNAWDVSNIQSMDSMFESAISFNQDISNWVVSNVNNCMFMFFGTTNFNQPLNTWDVSNVNTMLAMFESSGFNQPLDNWDVSNVSNMESMFINAINFDQNLGSWDISSLTTATNMFNRLTLSTENYDNTLIGWATLDAGETQIPSNINFGAGSSKYCVSEFERTQLIETYNWTIIDSGKEAGCINPNSFITEWETTTANESITIPTTETGYNYIVDWGDGTTETGITGDATHTYATAGTYTVSITGDFPRIYFNFDTSGNSEKIQNVVQWGTFEWTSMRAAFAGCSNLDVTATDAPNLSNATSTNRMFTSCTNLLGNTTFNTWDVSNIDDMSYMFSSCSNFNTDLNNWNVANVILMKNMFADCTSFDGNISTWNTGNVTDMSALFFDCSAFTGVGGLNNWNVSNVQKMVSMFRNCEVFNQDLNNWNTANLNQISAMFWGATAFNGNISTWNISGVQNLDYVFWEATNFNGDLSQWDVSNVDSMDSVFYLAENFNTPLNTWNVSNVTSMYGTFEGAAKFNQPLDNWDVSSVTFMYKMFYDATDFNQDLGAWDISNVSSMGEMLLNTSLSTENYDNLLIGWSTLTLNQNITFDALASYCLGDEDRQTIIDNFNWTFNDGGLDPSCTDVVLAAKVYLQGAALNPNIGEETLMRDDLRVAGMIPTRSPYADMLAAELTAFNITGNDAIVDWVWVELRDATDNTSVLASQSALLQRDGDIVTTDGTSALSFDTNVGNYFVVVKHRNHLGIMSANSIALSSTSTTVDFTNGSTTTFGSNAQTSFGMPSGVSAMWTGNVNNDTIVQYSGTTPDTPDILSEVLNDPGNFLNFPTYTVSGYKNYDINMDGTTQYSGTNPDTPIILQNVIAHPGNFLNFSTYQIIEQVPNTNN